MRDVGGVVWCRCGVSAVWVRCSMWCGVGAGGVNAVCMRCGCGSVQCVDVVWAQYVGVDRCECSVVGRV